MTFYRRRLPHWQPEGASIFLTRRLHGSLPRGTELAAASPNATEGQRFVALDRHMDRAVTGPAWLKDPRVANQILGRSGLRFWQDESYDHWVRDNKEFDRIARYTEWNPVRAGLVGRIEDWPWSSASARL